MVTTPDQNRQIAYSWHEAKRLAREQGYGERIELPKRSVLGLPDEFECSGLSIQGSAKAVYRDQRETDSFQVREYEDKWAIELDHHNPETGNAIAHAINDAPEYTIAAVAAIGISASAVIS